MDGWQALFLPDDQSSLPETEVADRDTVPILIPHGDKEAFSLSHFGTAWLKVWVASIENADPNTESNGDETGGNPPAIVRGRRLAQRPVGEAIRSG